MQAPTTFRAGLLIHDGNAFASCTCGWLSGVYHLVTIVPKGLKIALANHVRTHDPDASIGRKPEEIAVNSERRLKAISMYQLGYTQTYIASVLKVSASRVSAILRAYKRALHAIAAADTPYCPIPVSADYKKDHS